MIKPGHIDFYKKAILLYEKNHLQDADILCRFALSNGFVAPEIHYILGLIAQKVGEYGKAKEYLQNALLQDPSYLPAKSEIKKLSKLKKNKKRRGRHAESRGNNRFLLIKAWGEGFWSDMDHVLGSLLIAELTSRTPVVHWGRNSRYGIASTRDSFTLFFNPVSTVTIHDLVREQYSFYPPKWSRHNLHHESINKSPHEFSNISGIHFLNRHETVVVSDYHTYISNIIPWISNKHGLFGMDAQSIYRYLVNKYIHLLPQVEVEIEDFWLQNLAVHKPLIAVHVRASDKFMEDSNLDNKNKYYHHLINDFQQHAGKSRIFLLTDSEMVLQDFKERYRDQLIYTDCVRTSDTTGVHSKTNVDKIQIGIEIIKDSYLAARCDYFIGNGTSTVSASILHLKDWQPYQVVLLGKNLLLGKQFMNLVVNRAFRADG